MDFINIIIIASIIILLNYIIKGITGAGLGVLRNSLLLFLFDFKIVVPLGVILSFAGNLLLFSKTIKNIRKDMVFDITLGVILGSILGIIFLIRLESSFLKILFGAFIIIYSLYLLIKTNKIIAIKARRSLSIAVGFTGSFISSIFGSGGSIPNIIYIKSVLKDKYVFRSTLITSLLIAQTIRLLLYGATNILNLHVLLIALYLLPALAVGILIGNKIHMKLNMFIFDKIIASLLLILGITFIFS